MSADVDMTMSPPPQPGRSPYLWRAYKLAQASFWTADEIVLNDDREQWRSKLTAGERHFFSYILGFFAGSDGIVVENLALRFCGEIDIPEVRCFYGYQIMITSENVHAEVYSKCIQELVHDPKDQKYLFDSIKLNPPVRAKAQWCVQWIDSQEASLPTRIVAFAIVEGLFFSTSFAAIFWLRHRNLMPGLTFSNELIARDEGQHTLFACLLYQHLGTPIAEEKVHSMIREAVELEQMFFDSAIEGTGIVGITEGRMGDYVEYVADFLLVHLGYEKIYFTDNPFPFMERTAIDAKTNFFERQVSEYHSASTARPGV